METVRDRFWIWGHEAGSHTSPKAKKMWAVPGTSRMTPVEAAYYMDIPNCIMVVFDNLPGLPFHQHTLAMSPLKQVVWSVIGDASSTRNDQETDLEEVLDMTRRFPNVTGAIMDDFFHQDQARHSLAQLSSLCGQLHGAPRPLDLWVVLYHDQLDQPIGHYLKFCDVVTFWTMPGSQLVDLERNFERFLAVTPDVRRMLGCYMWNYGEKSPMPVHLMRRQCELGLTWLREGVIEGMIFLASCICDLDIKAVEWTRQWIAEVGDEPLARTSFG
jgi:hypothetical protein